ncbi:MAG: septum formation initiator family protein [Chloroherpetonaceae bacterium]|nr:septum formation initiator family protein [Chloroherpetonaceae bacterium]
MHQLQRLFTARTWRKLRLRARLRWFARDAMRSPLKYVRLAFLGLILFYTVFGNYGILARLRLEIHKSHLSAELTRETQRSNELRSAIQKMQTLEEIERWAREKYNLSLPSEIVYVIK